MSTASSEDFDDWIHVPRRLIRLPLEWPKPDAFVPEDPATWPRVDGRIEYVGGRLWFMPPCGQAQQGVVSAIVGVLWLWRRDHPQFFIGTNEAGMVLGGEVRAADAGVWAAGPATTGFARRAPVLAVEVGGRDEGEAELRQKARWYLEHGAKWVWLVLPDDRRVVILGGATDRVLKPGDHVPEAPELPGLSPAVSDFFSQLDPI